MKVTFSSDARRDRREAREYYAGISKSARHGFDRDLDRALRYVLEYPLGSETRDREVRAKRLLHFPLTILYRVVDGRILVLALADQRRDPEFYAHRLG